MRNWFAAFIAVFILIYGSISYYIGLRGWQWVSGLWPVSGWLYWAPFWLFSLAFVLARVPVTPRRLAAPLEVAGAYWLSLFQYLLPLLLLTDLVRAFGIVPPGFVTGAVMLLTVGALLFGMWRARNPVVVTYDVAIAKPAGPHKELHAVLVSDTHFGTMNGIGRVRHLVRMVGELKPDLLLIAGDLIDDDLRPFLEQEMAAELGRLKPRLGAYAILGNHDRGGGSLAEYRAALEPAGIRLLVDEWVKVDDSFYIAGRDDISGRSFVGGRRAPIEQLMQGVDTALPVILMDHQPSRLAEAAAAGADLLVAGHTHRGQMFPWHLITRRVFEVDWGYLRKGALHVIVSLGFGTWGPPMRIGNRPEVVSIRIRFA